MLITSYLSQSCPPQKFNFCDNAQHDGTSMSCASEDKCGELFYPLASRKSTFIASTGVSNEL